MQKLKPNKTVVEYETIEKNGESVTATEEEQEIIDVFSCSVKEAKDILRLQEPITAPESSYLRFLVIHSVSRWTIR